jgi:hypothetical protein
MYMHIHKCKNCEFYVFCTCICIPVASISSIQVFALGTILIQEEPSPWEDTNSSAGAQKGLAKPATSCLSRKQGRLDE